MPTPHAVISVDKGSVRVLDAVMCERGSTEPMTTEPMPLAQGLDTLRAIKRSHQEFAYAKGWHGYTTTWILPTKDTELSTVVALGTWPASPDFDSYTDVVVWGSLKTGVHGARLRMSPQTWSMLLALYDEYTSDGTPILILNGASDWSCAPTGEYDPLLNREGRLTAAQIMCTPADARHALTHVRVGVCVQPEASWGEVIAAIDARVARVSEIVLMFNCGDNADGTLPLSL